MGGGGLPDSMNLSTTPEAAKVAGVKLQTHTHTNSACKQGGKNQELQNEQIESHPGPTHPHTYQMEIRQRQSQTGVHHKPG